MDYAEYEDMRNRNRTEAIEAAYELRDALILVPAVERARLLAGKPELLSRLPSPEIRAEVLLADTMLSAEAELSVRQALAIPHAAPDLPAVITAALVPEQVPAEPAGPQTMGSLGGAGVVTPRHRVNNPWLRSLINLGRPLQATALAAITTIGVDSWHAVKAANASDILPNLSVFSDATTWPSCKDGLRSQTDYCIYTVSQALDWPHALAYLNTNGAEEQKIRAVNRNLGDDNKSWPPETRLLIWRGIRPEGSR